MSRRYHHRPEAAEVVEVLGIVPTTRRKGVRVARIRQGGADLVEIRSVSLDPGWQPSVGDHRTVVRSSAVGRVIAALQAAEAKAGDKP